MFSKIFVNFENVSNFSQTAYLEWNQTAIDSALNLLSGMAPRTFKSWKEVP